MTREGLAVAVTSMLLVVVGAAFGYPEVVLLGGASLAAVAVALASLLVHDDLSIDRVVDPVRVVEGGDATIRLTVSAVRRRRTLPVVAEVGLGPVRVAVAVPSLRRPRALPGRARPTAGPAHRRRHADDGDGPGPPGGPDAPLRCPSSSSPFVGVGPGARPVTTPTAVPRRDAVIVGR